MYQANTWVNDGGWKDVLAGEYRQSSAFAGYHVFVSAGHIERYTEDAISKFYETKKDDPIMAALIVKSLIHCWDNFEENAKMLAKKCILYKDHECLGRIKSHGRTSDVICL